MRFANLLQVLAESADHSAGKLVGTAYETFLDVVNIIMPVLISVVVAFGLVYGIILGIQFAKAEDTDGREKAKDRLINMIIGVVVTAVILAICYVILGSTWIEDLFPEVENQIGKGGSSSSSEFAALL